MEGIMFTSYDRYRIFYFVAKYKSISKAAEVLLTSQPNLTRTVKALEGELGCPLFLRTNRGMKLTTEGEKLFLHIEAAFSHIEEAEEELKGSRSLEKGRVTVAASEVALRCLLLKVLQRYRAKYPGVRIKISNHTTPQALAALKAGEADIAVITSPVGEEASLSVKKIRKVSEVAVCSKAFSHLAKTKTALSALSAYPLISLGKHTTTYEFYSDFFLKNGASFRPDIEAATADQVLPMVEADLGIGFVPEEFITLYDEVLKLDLKEKIPPRDICLAVRKKQPLRAAARELCKLIEETVSR